MHLSLIHICWSDQNQESFNFLKKIWIYPFTKSKSGPHKGMSAFLIDRNTPGITVQPDIKRMGIRGASNSEVVYTDVRLSLIHIYTV